MPMSSRRMSAMRAVLPPRLGLFFLKEEGRTADKSADGPRACMNGASVLAGGCTLDIDSSSMSVPISYLIIYAIKHSIAQKGKEVLYAVLAPGLFKRRCAEHVL